MKIVKLTGSIAFAILALLATSSIYAQGGGGGGTGGGGFPGGGGSTGGGSFNTGGTTGGSSTFNTGSTSQTTGGSLGGSTGGGTSGGGATNNSQPLNLNNQLNIAPTTPTAVDERNQGFIGPNSQQIIDSGFVGASTQLSGGQPTNGNSFGGGVNTQGSSGGGRSGGGALGAQGLRATGGAMGRNAGLGGFGNTNTAGVRRNVRSRLVNQVQVNRTPSSEVARRFSNRIDRLPTITGVGENVQISLTNGTATLTGNVPTAEAASKLERQLRLEPGVYKIDNRLQIEQ